MNHPTQRNSAVTLGLGDDLVEVLLTLEVRADVPTTAHAPGGPADCPGAVPQLLLDAHQVVVAHGGRMHSGPLSAALNLDVSAFSTELYRLLKAVGVERPVRIGGESKTGYLAETLETAIARYRDTRHTEHAVVRQRTPDGARSNVRIGVPEIATLLLNAFAAEGNPEVLTVARLADRLAAAAPAAWGRWNDRADRLAMVGRTLRSELKVELDIPTTRLNNLAGHPTAYRLADIHTAIRRLGAAS